MTGTYNIDTAVNGRDFGRFIALLAILGICPFRYTASADRVEVWVPRSAFLDGTHEVTAYQHYTFLGCFLEGET